MIWRKDIKDIEKLKGQLKKEFEMKDIGELKYFLGIQVLRNRRHQQIHVNQNGYINLIPERFSLLDFNPVSTPIATGTKLKKAKPDDNKLMDDSKEY